MTQGKRFLDQCVSSPVQTDPWPHQIIQQTFDESVFEKLRQQCQDNLMDVTGELIHIFPDQFKEHGIDFYDETVDICQNLYDNIQQIQGVYPNYRQYSNLGINAHISVTPPLPYKFHIHQEGLEKTWSSVTYITPKDNVGTKMYNAKTEDSFVKEAKWEPNSSFIFCGQQGKTWHSYESNQNTNRITFNLFVMKHRSKKCFFPL